MKAKKMFSKVVEKAVTASVVNSANSTTSGTLYQPTAPKELKSFSRLDK